MNKLTKTSGQLRQSSNIKQTLERSQIDDNYINNYTAVEIIIFLGSKYYTGDYHNLPERFFEKMHHSMGQLNSLTNVILGIKPALFQILKEIIMNRVANQQNKGVNVSELIKRISLLTNESEASIQSLIQGLSDISNVKSETKENTEKTLNVEESGAGINNELTAYQVFSNESQLSSSEGLTLLDLTSNQLNINELKYAKLRDEFYALMLEYNKDFMLQNIYVHKKKTYTTDAFLELFSVYTFLVTHSAKGIFNLGLIHGLDNDHISDETLIKEYLTQPGKIAIETINIMGMSKTKLSLK